MSNLEPKDKSVDNKENEAPPKTTGGEGFVFIEPSGGQTLRDFMKEHGKFSESELLSIMKNVFVALKDIHDKNMIHRSVKPEDIFINPDRKVYLLDFGLAINRNEIPDGQVIGTPAYMAPESFIGERPGVYSDIYSLGMVLYELLVGHRAYEADSMMEIMQMALSPQKHDPLLKLRPDISPRVAKSIEKALESEPENRWSSVSEFWSALTDIPLETQSNKYTEIVFMPFEKASSQPYPKLTPDYLATVINPYLHAVIEFQKIIDDVNQRQHSEISINLISQKSPISVSLDGASEAIS